MTDLQELLTVVDEHDVVIGAAPKDQVWREGLIHRVARVLIYNQAGDFLVQQRGDKPLHPLRWDVAVGGHVASGDSYLETAERETAEEVGVRGLALTLLGKHYLESRYQARPPVGMIHLRKFETVYRAELSELPSELATGEVARVAWWPVPQLRSFVEEHPDQITDGLHKAVTDYV